MPPAIALSFGAGIVGLALLGKSAAPESPASVAPAEAEPQEAEIDVPEETPAPPDAEPVDVLEPSSVPTVEGYDRLPDGSPLPELPKGAPSRVKFGVVLFEYEGAQAAPGQKAPRSRTKERARELDLEALAIAKSDFSKAVEKGDPGSTANAGFVPRGVLEPSVEYALFTLEKGTVHAEPIETPRGFWIVRRIQ